MLGCEMLVRFYLRTNGSTHSKQGKSFETLLRSFSLSCAHVAGMHVQPHIGSRSTANYSENEAGQWRTRLVVASERGSRIRSSNKAFDESTAAAAAAVCVCACVSATSSFGAATEKNSLYTKRRRT